MLRVQLVGAGDLVSVCCLDVDGRQLVVGLAFADGVTIVTVWCKGVATVGMNKDVSFDS